MSKELTIPEVLPFVRDLYQRNAVGCCLHIVLDDGNIKDKDVEFCINQAVELKGNYLLELLASLASFACLRLRRLAALVLGFGL